MAELIEQLYTGCLAQGAYYIEFNGEAAVIDPLRETDQYVELAEKRGAKIKYIFETHFHADFVSGHLDLAKKTGAQIVFGPTAKTDYDIYVGTDLEEFKIGAYSLVLLHTPGHTMESSTFLLRNAAGKDEALFTGDTLFLGDVGRPDLAIKSDLSREDLAGYLYESIYNKLMPLADDIIVYPGHGAGSACGKNMSKDTSDTLGNQKKTNYALQDLTKEQFIKEVTSGILPPPQYFAKNAMMNKSGYVSFDDVLAQGMKALSVEEFVIKSFEKRVLILDTRAPQTFNKGFIPNSINIGLDGKFAVWVGALISDLNTPILLVTDEGREEEAVTRLARVGYDNPVGYLKGGFDAWTKSGNAAYIIPSIDADEFAQAYKTGIKVLDVRNPNEYLSQHVEGVENFPLDYINKHLSDLDKDTTYYVHCAGGYRSMIASSILRKAGYKNLVDVKGGFGKIKETDIALTNYVCPSTL
ncbi:MBL fold metallo-hydrolase [Sediminitomix flava]|uniref:Glyoxylase-like metal-dependent hydrolase (Beta-lactamase superfamily II) n=1 Tax=Sediminitomix flava TaxID=379075 RepID=A0A315ZFZ1_SEDFL|nr:MBL fold metallo-hydrolase [Sediminitomix flava]PWJ43778.1 glyoxylase-like metal-dependent hydrolase (beta-lactamase superfamily II) [Sediminitomix flava]